MTLADPLLADVQLDLAGRIYDKALQALW